jgi:hypothetical protein
MKVKTKKIIILKDSYLQIIVEEVILDKIIEM